MCHGNLLAAMFSLCLSPAVLFGLGDVIAQLVMLEPGGKFDFPRLGRAWVFGTFILGPLAHFHFNFLDWLVVKRVRSLVPPL